MTRWLVTGASGLLGIHLALRLSREADVTGQVNQHALRAVSFDSYTSDLSEKGAAARMVDAVRPDFIINCAALANLDVCEETPELAKKLNADMPGELAKETARLSVPMIHISTDAVFDGSSDIYTESDPPRPLSLYAITKLDGEKAVLSENLQAIITRVNFFGWSINRRRSLAEWFYNQLSTGQSVKGFTDVYFCPLLVDDLADVLHKMIEAGLSGLYHVVGAECVNKYDFGRRIATQFGLDANLVHPASVLDGNLKAARSPNLNLSVEKLTRDLHIQIPGLDEQLAHFHQQFVDGLPEQLVGYCPDHG